MMLELVFRVLVLCEDGFGKYWFPIGYSAKSALINHFGKEHLKFYVEAGECFIIEAGGDWVVRFLTKYK